MKIKILGTGCPTCKSLEQATRVAISELGLEASIEKVEDIQEILEYGILRTPGLVINDEVVLSGKVPKPEEIKELLKRNS